MKQAPTIRIVFLLAALTLSASQALAAYVQPTWTISAGGGVTSSASFKNLGMIGPPSLVADSAGTGYNVKNGFITGLGTGFKLLYPVISATPGTLTFSVMATKTSAGQPIAVSNTGGGNLNWAVSKVSPDPGNIFSFTPASGTNTGSISVAANAAGLTPGTYSNSLSISGAGIDQTAQVQLDLTVTPLMYTLAVTLKLATPEKGGGTVTSTSPDSRLSCSRTGGASDVMCSADFLPGSSVTLSQTPDSNTQLASWGVPDCGNNQSCLINALNSDQGIDVIFPYASMAMLTSSGSGYDSLLSAYGLAASGDTINVRAGIFSEGSPGSVIALNSGKTVKLVGGLDANYVHSGLFTTLQNVIIVYNGRLNVTGGIKIKP